MAELHVTRTRCRSRPAVPGRLRPLPGGVTAPSGSNAVHSSHLHGAGCVGKAVTELGSQNLLSRKGPLMAIQSNPPAMNRDTYSQIRCPHPPSSLTLSVCRKRARTTPQDSPVQSLITLNIGEKKKKEKKKTLDIQSTAAAPGPTRRPPNPHPSRGLRCPTRGARAAPTPRILTAAGPGLAPLYSAPGRPCRAAHLQ